MTPDDANIIGSGDLAPMEPPQDPSDSFDHASELDEAVEADARQSAVDASSAPEDSPETFVVADESEEDTAPVVDPDDGGSRDDAADVEPEGDRDVEAADIVVYDAEPEIEPIDADDYGDEDEYLDEEPEATEGSSAPAPGDEFDPYPDQLLWPDEVVDETKADVAAESEDEKVAEDEEAAPEVAPARVMAPVPDLKPWDTPTAAAIPEVGDALTSDARLDVELFDDDEDEDEDGDLGQEGFDWQPPTQEEKSVAENKGKKRVMAVLIALVLISTFVGVYVLMVQSFEGKYLPRTTINGLDVGGMTREEAVAALEHETDDYGVEIHVGDYAGAFMGRHIGLSRDENMMVEKSWPEVDPRMWLPHLIVPQEFVVEDGIDFNEPVLRDVVMRSVDDHNNMALPHDQVKIELDEETGTYSLSGTTSGTAVDKNAVADAVVADVREFKTESTPDPALALHPAEIMDLPAYAYAVVRANICRTTPVPILVAGEQVDELSVEQERAWVTIDSEPKVVVDEDALRAWAEETVVYTAWHQDDWSAYSLDVDAFVAGLAGRLSLGIVEGYEVPVVDELKREGASREYAYERGGWNPELGRYIDVDLEAQFVRLFDETGNVIWESACVSGDVYQDRSTVTGVFDIYSKQTNATLVGLDYDNDGQPDYESFVNYWMPFYGGYGLHDATWRSTFGGDLYYYDGSHGCINLPFAKAKELFEITFVGEKVNVHW